MRGRYLRIEAIWLVGLGVLSACAAFEHKPLELPPPEAETVRVAYKQPTLTLVEGDVVQRKGSVTIALEPVTFQAIRSLGTPEHTLVQEQYRDGQTNEIVDVYLQRDRPQYTIEPERLTFTVQVTNHHKRILKLEGAAIVFRVGGKEVQVPQDRYATFLSGTLTPGTEQVFEFGGPDISALPQECLFSVHIFDVVTVTDAAGTPTARDNFEWFFQWGHERRQETETVDAQYVKNVWPVEICTTCGGRGHGPEEQCRNCNGTGRAEKQTVGGTCTHCNGTGRIQYTCESCGGRGRTLVRPSYYDPQPFLDWVPAVSATQEVSDVEEEEEQQPSPRSRSSGRRRSTTR